MESTALSNVINFNEVENFHTIVKDADTEDKRFGNHMSGLFLLKVERENCQMTSYSK